MNREHQYIHSQLKQRNLHATFEKILYLNLLIKIKEIKDNKNYSNELNELIFLNEQLDKIDSTSLKSLRLSLKNFKNAIEEMNKNYNDIKEMKNDDNDIEEIKDYQNDGQGNSFEKDINEVIDILDTLLISLESDLSFEGFCYGYAISYAAFTSERLLKKKDAFLSMLSELITHTKNHLPALNELKSQSLTKLKELQNEKIKSSSLLFSIETYDSFAKFLISSIYYPQYEKKIPYEKKILSLEENKVPLSLLNNIVSSQEVNKYDSLDNRITFGGYFTSRSIYDYFKKFDENINNADFIITTSSLMGHATVMIKGRGQWELFDPSVGCIQNPSISNLYQYYLPSEIEKGEELSFTLYSFKNKVEFKPVSWYKEKFLSKYSLKLSLEKGDASIDEDLERYTFVLLYQKETQTYTAHYKNILGQTKSKVLAKKTLDNAINASNGNPNAYKKLVYLTDAIYDNDFFMKKSITSYDGSVVKLIESNIGEEIKFVSKDIVSNKLKTLLKGGGFFRLLIDDGGENSLTRNSVLDCLDEDYFRYVIPQYFTMGISIWGHQNITSYLITKGLEKGWDSLKPVLEKSILLAGQDVNFLLNIQNSFKEVMPWNKNPKIISSLPALLRFQEGYYFRWLITIVLNAEKKKLYPDDWFVKNFLISISDNLDNEDVEKVKGIDVLTKNKELLTFLIKSIKIFKLLSNNKENLYNDNEEKSNDGEKSKIEKLLRRLQNLKGDGQNKHRAYSSNPHQLFLVVKEPKPTPFWEEKNHDNEENVQDLDHENCVCSNKCVML